MGKINSNYLFFENNLESIIASITESDIESKQISITIIVSPELSNAYFHIIVFIESKIRNAIIAIRIFFIFITSFRKLSFFRIK